jgi:hypothetical protein
MRKYQVYSVDPEGRVLGNRVIEAASDDDAIFTARSMRRQFNTEIWHRDRRVGRIAGVPRVSP